jgi:hypothetical protein
VPNVEIIRYALRDAIRSSQFQQLLIDEYVARGATAGDVQFPSIVSTTTVFNVETFPYVEIVASMSRTARNDDVVIDQLHELQLFWYERGDDEEALENAVNRALWTVRQYFRQYPYLNGVANAPIYLGDDNFSPFVPAGPYEARPFVKAGMTTIYVRTLD